MTNNDTNPRLWHLIDAEDQILGRISTQIADFLRGKNKTCFANNIDCGDYVVVVNAKKVRLTGNKEESKRYYKHTGYLGNLKTLEYKELKEKNPEDIIRRAVRGMLPKNRLQEDFLSRLKIFASNEHIHQNIKFE